MTDLGRALEVMAVYVGRNDKPNLWCHPCDRWIPTDVRADATPGELGEDQDGFRPLRWFLDSAREHYEAEHA